jgi:hypothetical protein
MLEVPEPDVPLVSPAVLPVVPLVLGLVVLELGLGLVVAAPLDELGVPLVLEPVVLPVPEAPVCEPPVLPGLAPVALEPLLVPEEPDAPPVCAIATPPMARAAAAARVVRVFLVVLMLNSLMQTPKGNLVEKSRRLGQLIQSLLLHPVLRR